QHFLESVAAVDHRPRRALGPDRLPFSPRRVLDHRELAVVLAQHHSIVLAGAPQRYAAFGHIARHQLGFAIERVAPAAAAGGHDAHDLALENRFAVNQPAEIARLAFEIDGDAERLSGLAAV